MAEHDTQQGAPATSVVGEVRALIDGALVEARSGARFANVNPATEQVLGDVTDCSVDDMNRAIAAARRAFDHTDWPHNRALRARCLEQLQQALEAHREQLRDLLVAEVGCPVMTTRGPQLDGPLAWALSHPASMIDDFDWRHTLPDGLDGRSGQPIRREVWKEPVGVVGAITPWNFPLEIILGKLGHALATGNTVVLKPAPDTPWSATVLGRLIVEYTDLPPGVVNIVPSSDHLVGEVLTDSPLVDLISFTGSTAVGMRIMERGGPTLKRLFLELGGKSASVVLDDADFAVAPLSGLGVCYHAGQGCAINTRLLLPRSRFDEGLDVIVRAMQTVQVGDPTDPATTVGPLVSARQRERVLGFIDRAVDGGARLVLGGGRPADQPTGYFVEPTIFAEVDPSSEIAQDEIFGPVLSVIAYDDDDDAVRIANNSRYGLSGAVHSGSLERALGVAARLRTGGVGISGAQPYGPDVPFGGYKHSGVGRQNGREGFEQYLETKSVAWPVQSS